MATANISACHAAVCAEYAIKINPHVSDVLEKTTDTKCVTLELRGNHRLSCVQRLDNRDVLALSKCLRSSTCVTGLDVSYNNITDEGVGHLADLLQCNSTLLSLRLSGNKIGNTGAMHLASMLQATQSVIAFAIALKSNRTLRSVDISRPLLFSHQEEWAVHFSEMLLLNSSLVELHLGKTGMTDTGMERLTEGLRLNRSLRYLDLRCNRVTRDGVRHLAETLKQNPTLEVIDLSSNRIEDEGAVYLSEAVAWPGCVLRDNTSDTATDHADNPVSGSPPHDEESPEPHTD
ncbi:Leucine-rich repeat-containing protein 34 [Collichthys lucidus]|uniref:Leucine-rich repeat-containing protein 34 n=1 Tax=Collichthys lucidus TaxID=240159 RepID=A0A4U5VJP1_COLLU|nr:Leucine-rich repeat-containing protein 34 [Collichthys lucidus]